MSILTSRIVQVSFGQNETKTYAYFTTDETIASGDYVVVVTPQSRDYDAVLVCGPQQDGHAPGLPLGYPKVARVVSTEETVESIERVREWIVCKLDFADYIARKSKEEQRKLLNAKIKRATEDAKRDLDLTALAAHSPELAKLLKQRDELT